MNTCFFSSTYQQFETWCLSYDRIISTKIDIYIVLGIVSDTLHILSHLMQKMIVLVYIEHIICSTEYITLEILYRHLSLNSH